MKRFIVYNLTNRGYLNEWSPRPVFKFSIDQALIFSTRERAEQSITDLLPQMRQRNEDNGAWCDGFALTVMEVYV